MNHFWCALALLFWLSPAHAQAPTAKCGPRTELVKALGERYSESPIAVGLIDATTIFEIFARTDGNTWTAVISRSDGISCLMIGGKAWEFVPFKVPGPPA